MALPRGRRRSAGEPTTWIGIAFAATLLAPLWLLLLAPLLLGVPHVLGDIRVLLCERLRSRPRLVVGLLVPLLAMTLLRAATWAGANAWPRLEIGLGVLAVAIGGCVGAARRRLLVLPVVALAGTAAVAFPAVTALVVAHGHNLVAMAMFVVWWPDRRAALSAAVAYVAAAAAIALGDGPVLVASELAGLRWSSLATSLAPGAGPELADRVVLGFGFAQAVHYAIWVWLLPRQNARPAAVELGRAGVGVAIALAVLVPVAGCCAPAAARDVYLSMAVAHGWLELAVAAALATGRR